jgi:hypothetical protein
LNKATATGGSVIEKDLLPDKEDMNTSYQGKYYLNSTTLQIIIQVNQVLTWQALTLKRKIVIIQHLNIEHKNV